MKTALGLGIIVAFIAPGAIAGWLGWYFLGDGGQFCFVFPYIAGVVLALAYSIGSTAKGDY